MLKQLSKEERKLLLLLLKMNQKGNNKIKKKEKKILKIVNYFAVEQTVFGYIPKKS